MSHRNPTSSQGHLLQRGEIGSGYPPAWPQPGHTTLTDDYPTGAADAIVVPGETPVLLDFKHVPIAIAVGIQTAVKHPHIRMLIMDMVDKAARVSFKPMVLPPWHLKPFRGKYLGGCGEADITTGNTDQLVQSFSVDEGHVGVLAELAQGLENAADWENVLWSLQVNEVNQTWLAGISVQIATSAQPKKLSLILPPGSTVRMMAAQNTGATINNVSSWLFGWQWPVANDGDYESAQSQAQIA